MNLAHVHLILNHIPVVALPIGLVFLIHYLWQSNHSGQKFVYLFLFVTSLSILPVFFSGEPAEEIIEHLPGVTEAFIESHEDSGQVALISTLMMGFASLMAFLFQQNKNISNLARNAVIFTLILAIGSLSYTAYLGGRIRHTEIRENPNSIKEIEQEH